MAIPKFLVDAYCRRTLTSEEPPRHTLWGAGILSPEPFIRESKGIGRKWKNVRSTMVRGPLTRKLLAHCGILTPPVYGSILSVLPYYYRPPMAEKRWHTGIAVTTAEMERAHLNEYAATHDDTVLIILPDDWDTSSSCEGARQPTEPESWQQTEVRLRGAIDVLCTCDRIVTGSLEALIIADAYAIPTLWAAFLPKDSLPSNYTFAFADYFLAVGRTDLHPMTCCDGESLEKSLEENAFRMAPTVCADRVLEAAPGNVHILPMQYDGPLRQSTHLSQNVSGAPPLLSIIVPIYNVKPYMERFMQSVEAQTLTDYELLLVDDGSDDGSQELCDYYAARNSRIRVCHTQHRGVSHARNLALDLCRGRYVTFADPDDAYGDSKTLEYNVEMLKQCGNRKGWVEFPYVEVDEKGQKRKGAEGFSMIDAPFVYQVAHHVNKKAWNKIFDARIFDNLRFEPLSVGECNVLVIQALRKADFILHSPVGSYIYYLRKGSASMRHYGFIRLGDAVCSCRLRAESLHYHAHSTTDVWRAVRMMAMETRLVWFHCSSVRERILHLRYIVSAICRLFRGSRFCREHKGKIV